MEQPVFRGVGVALVTVFDDDLRLQPAACGQLAAQLVDVGMSAVVVAGSTGEAKALSEEERDELLLAVRRAVPTSSGVPIIAGTGADTAAQAAVLTKRARECGADGFLVLSPPGSDDLVGYYAAVAAEAGGLPVLGYHFPAASSPGIEVLRLHDLPIHGLKDTSGDPERLLLTKKMWPGDLFTGSSALLSLAGQIGCAGAILTLANAMPEACIAAFEGSGDAQIGLIEQHLLVNREFPSAIKRLTSERFGVSAKARL